MPPKTTTKKVKPKAEDGTYPVYPYGHDFGNSDIVDTMIKDGKKITRSISTAFAKMSYAALKNMGVDVANSVVIQIQGESSAYGIGDLVMVQASSSAWHGRGDAMRNALTHSLRAI